MDQVINDIDFVYSTIVTVLSNLDFDYLSWVAWVIYPILITFLLPLCIVVLIYVSALVVYIYKQRNSLQEAYTQDFWQGCRSTVSVIWYAQAKIWHGYEVEGLHNIPETGACLVIYYHGVLPVDLYYVIATLQLTRGQTLHAVGDRFLFQVPGWSSLLEMLKVAPGTLTDCVDVLRGGKPLSIAPGGVREALFSDENYTLLWNQRSGFAKVALQANVPIIPMFTVNIREAFRTPSWARAWLRGFYEYTRLPLVPVYGFFPVKLKTIFGEPIYPDPGLTHNELADKVRQRVEEMISQHQPLPGSILRALLQRLPFIR